MFSLGSIVGGVLAISVLVSSVWAQQAVPSPAAAPSSQAASSPASPQASPAPASAAAKAPVAESTSARLLSARKVLVTRTRGSNIPYDVMTSTLSAWPQFTLVDSPEQADIVVNVETSGENDVRVSGGSSPNPASGQMEQNSKTSKDISVSEIRVTVFDARNKRVLWTSSEKVKFAIKKTTKESNMVEAAEQLASRFHDRIEASVTHQ